jgi:hypothetical protein
MAGMSGAWVGALGAATASAEAVVLGRWRTEAFGLALAKGACFAVFRGSSARLLATTVRVTKGLAGGGALRPRDTGAELSKAMCTKKTPAVNPTKVLKFWPL